MGAFCCGTVKRIYNIEATLNEFKEQVAITSQAVTDAEAKIGALETTFTAISGQVGDVKGDCSRVFVAMEKVPEMNKTMDQLRAAAMPNGMIGLMSFGMWSAAPTPVESESKPTLAAIDSTVLAAMSGKAQQLYKEGKRQQAYELFLDCYKKCAVQLGDDDTNTLNCKAWAAHIEDEIATYSDSESDSGSD